MKIATRIKPLAALLGGLALSLTIPMANAAQCDLTGGTDGSCTLNGALYQNPTNLANVGTGVFDPFLSVQNSPIESGYSTDSTLGGQFAIDDTRNNFTNTFSLSQLGTVTVGGTQYFQFFLDAHEPNTDVKKLLNLNYLNIYDSGSSDPFLADRNTTPTNDLAGLVAYLGSTGGNTTPLYSLGNNDVMLDTTFFAGSGLGIDLQVLIPVANFAGVDPTHRLVFATTFGFADSAIPGISEATFEEWSYLKANAVPEPGSLALLGMSLTGLAALRRRRSTV